MLQNVISVFKEDLRPGRASRLSTDEDIRALLMDQSRDTAVNKVEVKPGHSEPPDPVKKCQKHWIGMSGNQATVAAYAPVPVSASALTSALAQNAKQRRLKEGRVAIKMQRTTSLLYILFSNCTSCTRTNWLAELKEKKEK